MEKNYLAHIFISVSLTESELQDGDIDQAVKKFEQELCKILCKDDLLDDVSAECTLWEEVD